MKYAISSVLEEKSRYYAAVSRAVYLLSFGDRNCRLTEKLPQRGIDRKSADAAATKKRIFNGHFPFLQKNDPTE